MLHEARLLLVDASLPLEARLALVYASLLLVTRLFLVDASLPMEARLALIEASSLLDFDELVLAFDRQDSLDALAIAQVNRTLGTDAVFAARLLRDLSAVCGDAPAPGSCAESAAGTLV